MVAAAGFELVETEFKRLVLYHYEVESQDGKISILRHPVLWNPVDRTSICLLGISNHSKPGFDVGHSPATRTTATTIGFQ